MKTIFHLIVLMAFGLVGLPSEATAATTPKYEERINALQNKLERIERKSEFDTLKNELNMLGNELQTCENSAQKEVDSIQKVINEIQPSVSGEVKDKGNTGKLSERESKAQKLLMECKYYSIKLAQLKDQYLEKLSSQQLSGYLHQTQIYWDMTSEKKVTYWSEHAKNLYLFYLAYIAVLSLILMITSHRPWFKQALDYRPLLTVISCVVIAGLAIVAGHKTNVLAMSTNWLIWSSIILIPKFLKSHHVKDKVIYGVLSGTGLVSSNILMDEVIWESGKYFHLMIMSFAVISIVSLSYLGRIAKHKRITLVVIAPIIALEAFEYHIAAHQLVIFLYLVLIILSLHHILNSVFDSLMEFLQKTSFAPIRVLREGFMEGISETIPGFKWVKWTFYLSFMSLSLLSLLGFSGLSESIIESVRRAFSEGFYVGTILINIKNILVATFILGILIIISWMLKQKIERKNSQSNEMEIGGQAAKAALFWYASIVTSFLIALSVSGFSVQNLALIAGAFSVGIGFGLQNIVSNFISGIILLIERPVKPGDWVRIGDTEGFIQKISIRATQLRTFDKADILVPNSELISNHVTNMMLSDSVGRIKVEVGVAYGSDTAKVKEILETIINENDAIVKNDEALTPSIIFKAFGDSSLNFEVRGFIRDISEIFRVRSQIHFAIDNAFRENGIEIPFPQRDLHVKTWFGKKDMPKESDND